MKQMKVIISLMRVLFTLIILFLLLINLVLMLSVSADNQKPPNIMEIYLTAVEQTDMSPTLHPDDVLLIKPESPYEIGEVIACNIQGKTVIRRIIGTFQGNFITGKDADSTPDDILLAEENILGEAVFHVPNAAFILNWLISPVCTISLIAAWLLIVLIPMLLDRKEDI